MAGTVICDYINSANVSGGFLGIGQTWQDVTSQRAKDIVYTNSTGKPIMVNVRTYSDSNTQIIVNSVIASSVDYYGNSGGNGTLFSSAIIPANAQYRLQTENLVMWSELR